MNAAVTIVLPVHNAERTLRGSVMRMMELAVTTGRQLQVVVVDDGSTDATFEIACELASEFPQIRLLRQPYQRGLGAALEQVRSKLGVGDVIAHDGVSPIDHQELATLLAGRRDHSHALSAPMAAIRDATRGRRRLAGAATIDARLMEARRTGTSFRWLRVDEPAESRRKRAATPVLGTALNELMPSLGVFGTPFAKPR